ncbi:uncharacterized protein PG986_002208 [Apiospora aurea]|uniref:Nephrocystin 3-like N-terminal domain-containing protein n=1 Tax=Apiospora aurea TaxID=335848 RepID=A0ABR1QYZ3_9PEZI
MHPLSLPAFPLPPPPPLPTRRRGAVVTDQFTIEYSLRLAAWFLGLVECDRCRHTRPTGRIGPRPSSKHEWEGATTSAAARRAGRRRNQYRTLCLSLPQALGLIPARKEPAQRLGKYAASLFSSVSDPLQLGTWEEPADDPNTNAKLISSIASEYLPTKLSNGASKKEREVSPVHPMGPREERWRVSGHSETLWFHGIPGAGKAKLSTRVVDAAVSEAVESYGLVVLRPKSRGPPRSWAVGIVHDEYRKHQAKGFAADMTFHERTELLGRLASLYQKVFLVVDGLDECDRTTRRSFMDTLESVRISSTSTVKVLVASRDDGDIKTRYEATSNLLISASDNQEDIERFVLAQIDASTWRDNPKMHTVLDEVIDTFKTKSQGMFLWASLHIRDLLELQRPTDIRLYLKQLPEGLRKTYDQIFAKWLMCSWRPLRPEELLVLVCQDSDTDLSFKTDITPQYLLEAYHNLIVVTTPGKSIQEKETAGWTRLNLPPPSRSFCRFAHLSVQEYFESNHWNMEKCNSLATQACMHLLATPSFMKLQESWQRIEFDPRKYDQICEELPVSNQRRCSVHTNWGVIAYLHGWFLHATSCGTLYHEVSRLIGTFVGRPYDASEAYKNWLHAMDPLFYQSYRGHHAPHLPGAMMDLLKPVSMAALGCVACGLVELVEDWIHEGIRD